MNFTTSRVLSLYFPVEILTVSAAGDTKSDAEETVAPVESEAEGGL